MVTNQDLKGRRESGCWGTLVDRKYYQVGSSCIKRSLRRHEWQSTAAGVLIVPPTTFPQRWRTDAAILQFLGERTNIPLPRLQCVFEDDGAFYHCTEYVPGVTMSSLGEDDKAVVMDELRQHLAALRDL